MVTASLTTACGSLCTVIRVVRHGVGSYLIVKVCLHCFYNHYYLLCIKSVIRDSCNRRISIALLQFDAEKTTEQDIPVTSSLCTARCANHNTTQQATAETAIQSMKLSFRCFFSRAPSPKKLFHCVHTCL